MKSYIKNCSYCERVEDKHDQNNKKVLLAENVSVCPVFENKPSESVSSLILNLIKVESALKS
jgi:hypothetical protein